MSELENIELFFSEKNERRRRGLRASFLAKESGINAITLRKFINNEHGRNLTPKQIELLVPVLVDFGYRPLNVENQFL